MRLRPITKRPTKIIPIYACPVCGTYYRTQAEAAHCRDSLPIQEQLPPGLKAGDVVIIRTHGCGYTWYEDANWVAEKHPAQPDHDWHFFHKDTYSFYHVVTHIGLDRDSMMRYAFVDNRKAGHRAVVSLATRAISRTGKQTAHGFIFADKNLKVLQCESKTQSLVAEVKDLIGTRSDYYM